MHDRTIALLWFTVTDHINKVVVVCAQSKSTASSMRDWTEQETLLLLEVQIILKINCVMMPIVPFTSVKIKEVDMRS